MKGEGEGEVKVKGEGEGEGEGRAKKAEEAEMEMEAEAEKAGATAAMEKEGKGDPIPTARLKELEQRALWGDAREETERFKARAWPGMQGVYWRMTSEIERPGRKIARNSKAIPSGKRIITAIFVGTPTAEVRARTHTRARAHTHARTHAQC